MDNEGEEKMKQLAELISMIQPEFQGIASYLFSILIILIIFNLVLKQLQMKEMRFFLSKLRRLDEALLVKITKNLQVPIKYPSLELLESVLFTIYCYLMTLYLYTIFVWINFLIFMSTNVSIGKRMTAYLLALFFILVARLFFAEGERNRFSIPVLWKNLCK